MPAERSQIGGGRLMMGMCTNQCTDEALHGRDFVQLWLAEAADRDAFVVAAVQVQRSGRKGTASGLEQPYIDAPVPGDPERGDLVQMGAHRGDQGIPLDWV